MNNRDPIKNAWWVVVDSGMLRMYDGKGQPVFGEIFCRVHDEQGEIPRAIVKMFVNIASTEQDMMNKIKELDKEK